MAPSVDTGTVPVAGGELYYETSGEGHPVVLIHAALGDRRLWDPQFATLARRYRVIRYDVRGFGRSPAPTGSYTSVDDLETLLDRLDVDQIRLLGVSNGGRIALDFAVERPGRVEALVPICSGLAGYTPSNDAEEVAAFARLSERMQETPKLRVSGGTEAALNHLTETWVPALSTPERSLVRRIMRENLDWVLGEDRFEVPYAPPAAERLRELNVPTLVVEGERDQPAMHFIADYLFAQIPGAKRTVIRGGDHLPNLSNTAAFDRAIEEFLE